MMTAPFHCLNKKGIDMGSGIWLFCGEIMKIMQSTSLTPDQKQAKINEITEKISSNELVGQEKLI